MKKLHKDPFLRDIISIDDISFVVASEGYDASDYNFDLYGALESTFGSSSSTDNYQGYTDGTEYFNETTGEWEIVGDDYQNINMDSRNQYTYTHESEFDNDYFVEDQWWVKGNDWVAEDVPDISELTLTSTDSIGANFYTGQSQDSWSGDKTYILPEGATEAILVTEDWGGFANLNNDWGMVAKQFMQ